MHRFERRRSLLRSKSGSFALLTAMLACLVILPIGLFTFEIGRINLAQKELKAVTDAAALAAAVAITKDTSTDPAVLLDVGRQAGLLYLKRNTICNLVMDNSVLSSSVETDTPALGNGTLDVQFDQATSTVTAKAAFGMPPAFGILLGLNTVTIRGLSKATTAAASGIDVILLFDYSDSMESGGVFQPAKVAAANFIGTLKAPSVHLGLTYFALNPQVAIPLSKTNDNIAAAQASMSSLGGTKSGTNTGDAILAALSQLKGSEHRPDAKKVIVMITDGLARKPGGLASGTAYALSAATQAGIDGVTIYGIGFFHTGSENLLQAGSDFMNEVKLATGNGSEVYTATTVAELNDALSALKMTAEGGVALIN